MTTRLRHRDAVRFVRSLSAGKLTNAGKVFSSYYYSRLTGRPAPRGLPFTLSVEPTTACNLRCPQCPSGLRSFTRDTGMMSFPLFRKAVDELEHSLLFLYLYFQGEPYLHPAFTEMVSYGARKNIYTVTSTNAHFLDDENARKTVESGLSRIIISIDGASQQSYEKYRVGGNLQQALSGMKNLAEWKKKLKSATPHVIFQTVIFSHNEHEIDVLKKMADEYGADEVNFKTAQIYDFETGNSLIPRNPKYARYNSEAGLRPELTVNSFYKINNPLLNHCWKMWHSCAVTWDGKVVPCCFDKDATHVMGDLKKQSFREIWKGEPYREFRSRLFVSRKETDICKNCSEGTKVWVKPF